MSRFISSLIVEHLDKTYEDRELWRLVHPLVYRSDLAGTTFVVPAGFITDFASVPRIPLAYMLTGGYASRAAVIHDWLYATKETDRETADAVLREASEVQGVPAWRRELMYRAVRLGGGEFYGNPKFTFIAP